MDCRSCTSTKPMSCAITWCSESCAHTTSTKRGLLNSRCCCSASQNQQRLRPQLTGRARLLQIRLLRMTIKPHRPEQRDKVLPDCRRAAEVLLFALHRKQAENNEVAGLVIFKKKVAGISSPALDRFVRRARRAARIKGTVDVLITSSGA